MGTEKGFRSIGPLQTGKKYKFVFGKSTKFCNFQQFSIMIAAVVTRVKDKIKVIPQSVTYILTFKDNMAMKIHLESRNVKILATLVYIYSSL